MIQLVLTLIAALSIILTTPLRETNAAEPEPAAVETTGPTVGQPAPDFTGTDSNGKTVKLSDFKGKTVVLEWTNHECPFVRKMYDTETMQNLQKEATAKGVVWLSVVSSAEGKQGFTRPDQANEVIKKRKIARNIPRS